MRSPDELIYLFLFLLQLLELVQLQCPAARMVDFIKVRPTTKTPEFYAVTNAGVKQRNNKKLKECSGECADNFDCVGFNYKEPFLCELFTTQFGTLTLAPGCTYYEVSPDVITR